MKNVVMYTKVDDVIVNQGENTIEQHIKDAYNMEKSARANKQVIEFKVYLPDNPNAFYAWSAEELINLLTPRVLDCTYIVERPNMHTFILRNEDNEVIGVQHTNMYCNLTLSEVVVKLLQIYNIEITEDTNVLVKCSPTRNEKNCV